MERYGKRRTLKSSMKKDGKSGEGGMDERARLWKKSNLIGTLGLRYFKVV